MGIIDFKTSLKSLKYGKDIQGGGDSNEPYIQVDINNQTEKSGLSIASIDAAATDVLRIGKFLTDPSKGPKFIATQVGLQLSNPRLEVLQSSLSSTNSILNTIDQGINFLNNQVGSTRLYNLGVNTLAQVAASGLEQHIVRHGLLPIISDQDKYAYIVKQNDINGNNRLIRLSNTVLLNPSNLIIDDYFGGPNSLLGIGNTTIHRTDVTNDTVRSQVSNDSDSSKLMFQLSSVDYSKAVGVSSLYFSTKLFNSASITDIEALFPTNPPDNDLTVIGSYTNVKSTIAANTNTLVTAVSNLSKNRIINVDSSNPLVRSTISNIGSNLAYTTGSIKYTNTYGENITIKKTWRTGNRETRVGSGRKDQMNLFSLFTQYAGNSTSAGGTVLVNGQKKSIRDFVKFRIEAIDNDDPTKFVGMAFRAYLSGFSDNYSPEWNEVAYVGRGETFENFNKFRRQISFKFKVAALSRDEMMPMYQKLNYLASNTAPDYSNNLMRGPMIRLTIGNYIYHQPGRISDLNISVPDDAPWEIAIDQPEQGSDARMYELPHVLEVSMGFRPFHNFLPQKSAMSPFILDKNPENGQPRNPWLNVDLPAKYSTTERVIMKATDNDKVL